jgi:hypothetical protein
MIDHPPASDPDPCFEPAWKAGGFRFDPGSCRTFLRTAWKAIPAKPGLIPCHSGQALLIPRDPAGEAFVARDIAWDKDASVALIDFMIMPWPEEGGGFSNLYLNGSQIAFQVKEGSFTAEVWVLAGDVDNVPPQWLRTSGLIPLDKNEGHAAGFSRIIIRQDFIGGVWDLSLNGAKVAAKLPLTSLSDSPFELRFYASKRGDVLIDDLSVRRSNPAQESNADSLVSAVNMSQDMDWIGIDPFLDLYLGFLSADDSEAAMASVPMDNKSNGSPPPATATVTSVAFQVFTPLR